MGDERIKMMLRRIKQRRLELSYSQEYMAVKLNISQKGYSKIELNAVKLTADRLCEICEILDIEMVDIFKNH